MLNLPSSVAVNEVCPRDGLQSFPRAVDTDTKVRLVDRLSDAGLPLIEVSGFAHPRAIPNLADAEEVFARIRRRPGTVYRGLVPNARGAQRAAAARVDEMLGLIICSQAYLTRNQNMTIDKAVDEAVEAFRIADGCGSGFVMALGMSFWCPYEGRIPEETVLGLLQRFRNAGMRRFYLAGSVGMEDPRHVHELFSRAGDLLPDIELGFHVHNLAGMATGNILAALQGGARFIEGAICGIGGGIAMPQAMGAVGNFPTEDLVSYLELMGVDTGIDPQAVIAAAADVAELLQVTPRSHTANGITREKVRRMPEAMA
ncbi:hydroxymethylglutaryl-CoA lyase [Xylophilus rhododendri]|uniref:Hydroxymethylglutaryl-CoA lyase n=1 Tax=Xylophilus rhododendri TaxID=2697032 RepID=A0A857J2I3_9BURK|nr:hydroxymethylglutaryl-CoA lyase [Xylophilus rhododendri]QHI97847.1 hydroxymethylglutaryl-CoA lyase [Xylophilus rhododendri]